MAFRAILQFMDWAVQARMVYGLKRSRLDIARKDMFYLLYYTDSMD